MKKYSMLTMTLVLTAALFTGCGCRNGRVEPTTTMPTVLPTVTETTVPVTEAPHEATTLPPEKDTTTHETIDHGNGPIENGTTNATENTNERARTNPGTTVPGNASRARKMPVG